MVFLVVACLIGPSMSAQISISLLVIVLFFILVVLDGYVNELSDGNADECR